MKKEKRPDQSEQATDLPGQEEEIKVYVLDKAMFLQIEKEYPIRVHTEPGQRDPSKKVTVWVFRKTERVEQLLREIDNPQRPEVKYLRLFLDEAMSGRVLKRNLERGA